MNRSTIIVLVLGVIAITGAMLWNQYAVQPGIPVWAEGEAAVRWDRDRLPLKVSCESGHDDCAAAVDLWNRAAGCAVLVLSKPCPCDIRIIDASVNDPERGTAWEKTFASKTGDRVNYVEIRLYEPAISMNSSYSMQYAVNTHAISHGLGLSHTATGITREVQSPNDPFPRSLDKHAAALNERYCR